MTQPSAILCPRCHKPNRGSARFCQHCSHDLILNNTGPRYSITRVVKAGGQGAVYEAVGDDGKIYAVKEMLDSFADQQERDEGIARFEAEAKLLEQLSHPRIPRVYTSFKDEGRHYLVMDFVRGEDLEEVVEREGAIPESRVLNWAGQICDVLDYLHDHGLIYRDMKPSNVMVEPHGGIKLVDFGIAKVLQQGQRGTQIGTPGYAPPEQYQGIATITSDVYALGATLHHLLTGRDPRSHPPFSFPPAQSLNATISTRTADALAHALQMKQEDRFHSLEEFRNALGVGANVAPATATVVPAKPVPAAVSQPAPTVPPSTPPPTVAPAPRSAPAATPASRSAQAARPAPTAIPTSAPVATAPTTAPTAAPVQRRSRGCLSTVAVIAVLALLVLGYLFMRSGSLGGLLVTPTPQTLVQQSFQLDNLEIIVPAGTDDAGLQGAFEYALLELARQQYGPNVQLQPGSVTYANGQPPEQLGEDQRGVRYRASLQGIILVPRS